MTTRHVRRAFVASLLTFGMGALAPTTGRAQNSTTIPDEGQMITLTGCFTRGVIGKSTNARFVLAKPVVGTVANVAEPSCAASGTDQLIKLQDLKQVHMGGGQFGRWVQISGRLEGNHRKDGLREVHVKSFSLVPVVVPAPAVAAVIIEQPAPAPAPQVAEAAPAPEPAPEPAPVATSGVRKSLPKTATSLPLVGLIGFLSLAGGLALHLFNRRTIEPI